jgi:two-component system response regulator PilR (NtrC family)/two-component system response regulator HydG
MPERVIVVEDDHELRALLDELLRAAGYEVTPVPGAEAALEALAADCPADLVITDLVMPGMRGEELLVRLKRERPELNVIVITAFGSIDSAIELVKAGAYDYVTKPFSSDELLLAVERALSDSKMRRELAHLSRIAARVGIPGFIGASAAVNELFRTASRAAHSRHPVLLTGESGTGKELVARGIHRMSGRASFVAINCGALPEHLLESELFGHEKGSFTGAERAKPGLLETAHGGTAFLDEVAELPLSLQPKLLRALEYGEIRRIGATEARALDIRIIAATNRDLEEEVRAGRFREDLFWRLNVIHIHIPPLRERPSDIPLLAEQFLASAAQEHPNAPKRISAEAMALLTAYPWPGNARELRNAIQRAAVLAAGEELTPEDLPPRIRKAVGLSGLVTGASQRRMSLRDLEREYVLEVLRQVDGNKTRAAEILGLDRKTLYRKLEEYGYA